MMSGGAFRPQRATISRQAPIVPFSASQIFLQPVDMVLHLDDREPSCATEPRAPPDLPALSKTSPTPGIFARQRSADSPFQEENLGKTP
jgi:hypothetical protein